METINIVFSSDNNYAQYMGVAICSLFENKKGEYPIHIYVLDGGINEDSKNKLKVLEDRYNFKINYINIDQSIFDILFLSKHLTQATYYRLLLADLLPNIDKLLYLDCDIVIINDLLELYNTDLNNYYLGAIDEEVHKDGHLQNLGIPENGKYFNAGVLLINLKKWRDENISPDLFNLAKSNNFEWHDQDTLNKFTQSKWLPLSYKYNYMAIFYELHPYKSIEDIIIIHYTTVKPWNYISVDPLKKYYFEYLNQTPWKNIKFANKNIKSITIKIFENLIIFMFSKSIIKKVKNIKRKLGVKLY